MNALFNYLWEASLAILLLYLFYRIFLARSTFFSWNRAYLIIALIFAMVLPLLTIPVSNNTELAPALLSYNLPEFQFSETQNQNQKIGIIPILLGVYLLGFTWKLGMLGYGLLLTFQKIRKSRKIKQDGICLVIHPEFQPASFFHYIFLPEYAPEDPNHYPIVKHEAVHADKWHTLDLLLFQFASAILWFHPVWTFFEAQLREVHEFEADREVTHTYPKTDYAKLLLGLLITESHGQLMNNFNHFQTKKRIKMMMKNEKPKAIQKALFLLAFPLMAAMLVVFACDTGKEEDFAETLDIPLDVDTLSSTGDEIFDVVEDSPEFEGGMEEWSKFLGSTLHYPDKAKEMGIEGTVYVVFEIQKDGRVTNPEILRGIGGGCDEEALRVIRQSPDWIPGKQNGREVAVRMRLPIRFKLS
ncbi:TonB family protein [Arthrospiribacter ruber]|uniref:TonB family protein n=1 Tax=Arthrospiribacter ruber TaxID=2487934 RepID=A0A951IZX3_9BACT|nr:TonB family protein [Arthrospiribacter ruber]MBW3470023.1 TonB family protein [Arthrospiribacter ruber]